MPPSVDLPRIQQFVVEWFVEDPGRYERLTRHPLPDERRVWKEGRMPMKDTVTPTVITVVLNVPRHLTDAVTAQLREQPPGPNRYLRRAAEAADREAGVADRAFTLETQLTGLRLLALEMARALDMATTGGFGGYHSAVRYVDEHVKQIEQAADSERRRVNAALTERSAEVAAVLLAAIPDSRE